MHFQDSFHRFMTAGAPAASPFEQRQPPPLAKGGTVAPPLAKGGPGGGSSGLITLHVRAHPLLFGAHGQVGIEL